MEKTLLTIISFHVVKIFQYTDVDKAQQELHITLAYYANTQQWQHYWSTAEDNGVTQLPHEARQFKPSPYVIGGLEWSIVKRNLEV